MTDMLAARTWLVIGDVTATNKPAHAVVERLRARGRVVYQLNPRLTDAEVTALSLSNDKLTNSFATLTDAHIDVVDLCINPIAGLSLLQSASSAGIKNVFIQPGAGSPDIDHFAKTHNMTAHNGCVLREM